MRECLALQAIRPCHVMMMPMKGAHVQHTALIVSEDDEYPLREATSEGKLELRVLPLFWAMISRRLEKI